MKSYNGGSLVALYIFENYIYSVVRVKGGQEYLLFR